MHVSRALQSPRDFDYGPGPGLSPSPKVGPRALEKTRAPGRARAGPRPGPITRHQLFHRIWKKIQNDSHIAMNESRYIFSKLGCKFFDFISFLKNVSLASLGNIQNYLWLYQEIFLEKFSIPQI